MAYNNTSGTNTVITNEYTQFSKSRFDIAETIEGEIL